MRSFSSPFVADRQIEITDDRIRKLIARHEIELVKGVVAGDADPVTHSFEAYLDGSGEISPGILYSLDLPAAGDVVLVGKGPLSSVRFLVAIVSRDRLLTDAHIGSGEHDERYLQSDVGVAFTPDLTGFSTPADVVKSGVTAGGRWRQDGRRVRFSLSYAATVTHTGVGGGVRVTLPGMPLVDNDGWFLPVVGFITGWTKTNYVTSLPRAAPGESAVSFLLMGNAATTPLASLAWADIPTGTLVNTRLVGEYMAVAA